MAKTVTHDTRCYVWNKHCPCLSCKHDTKTGDPLTVTKCCDLVNHRGSCKDDSLCMDYEPIEEEDDAI